MNRSNQNSIYFLPDLAAETRDGEWSEDGQEEIDPESLQGTQEETLRWAAPVSPGQNGPVRAKFGRSLDEL